jgi:hypothetical protein
MASRLGRSGTLLVCAAALLAAATGCGGSSTTTTTTVTTEVTSDTTAVSHEASHPVLTKRDCVQLGRYLTHDLHHKVSKVNQSHAVPPHSSCELTIKGGFVSIGVSPTRPVREDFLEGVLLSSSAPRQAVPHLGQIVRGHSGAYWAPAEYRLYTYRRSGWFTLFWPRAASPHEARQGAIGVTRRALELTE